MKKVSQKFELNTRVLENFDEVMSVKLDEVKELKVTGFDKGSKWLNIISLCANVKTLILEGDARLNADKILANIFKPEKLENLVLNNVKVPTKSGLKRFENLKRISLKNIRFCNIREFFEGILVPQKIEEIIIANTDMAKVSISILGLFPNLKYITLDNLQNEKLDDFSFLENNKKIVQINFTKNEIPLCEINHLLNSKCKKNIDISIKSLKATLKITEKDSELVISIDDLEEISHAVNLQNVENLNLNINKMTNIAEYMPFLKHQKNKLHVMVKDFSCLDAKSAHKLRKRLSLKKIKVLSEKHKTNCDLEHYIRMRQELEKIIASVADFESEPEKFLGVYQYLGKEYIKDRQYTVPQLCRVLQNSLKCLHIKSNIIAGKELENEKQHYWNQVELEGRWYHVDLGLDIANLQKNKAEYCLLGNDQFFETHVPKAGKNHYCAENFNQKLVNVFLKTGLYKESLFGSYLEIMIQKIKQVLNLNQKQEVLALPQGKEKRKKK